MKISILVKIYENLDFGQDCRIIMILVNILGKISSLVNIFVKIDLVKIFPKSWFWSKLSENVNLGQNLQICLFWSNISKNLDFGQNFWKYRFLLSLSKNLKYGQICLKKLDFGHISRKFSISVKV